MSATITIKGLNEALSKFDSLPGELETELDAIAQDAALLWEERAKNDAPVDYGFLRGHLTVNQLGPAHYEVVSGADYSAYIEWGTKTKVDVPADLTEYAAQFKTQGPKGGFAAIKAWAARKGLAPEIIDLIAASVIRRGVTPHPFFFIQQPVVEAQVAGDLKNLV